MGNNKQPYEECIRCEKEYKLYSKGSILGEVHKGQITKGPHKGFVIHSHICLCPKCSKEVLEFIRKHLGQRKFML